MICTLLSSASRRRGAVEITGIGSVVEPVNFSGSSSEEEENRLRLLGSGSNKGKNGSGSY